MHYAFYASFSVPSRCFVVARFQKFIHDVFAHSPPYFFPFQFLPRPSFNAADAFHSGSKFKRPLLRVSACLHKHVYRACIMPRLSRIVAVYLLATNGIAA